MLHINAVNRIHSPERLNNEFVRLPKSISAARDTRSFTFRTNWLKIDSMKADSLFFCLFISVLRFPFFFVHKISINSVNANKQSRLHTLDLLRPTVACNFHCDNKEQMSSSRSSHIQKKKKGENNNKMDEIVP